LSALLVAVAALAGATPALAGGMQLPTRGVRPSARAGAFVAGADDLGALWFNPAGLVHFAGGKEKGSFLFDIAYVTQSVEYTRIDSGGNPQQTVKNDAPGMPIPTVALAFDLGDRMVIGGGIYAPYAGLGRYPEDGPQRYSLIDLSETLLFIVEVAVGYRVTDKIRVGAGIQDMVFRMSSTLIFSGCPGETVCAPEDPEFDALSKVTQLSLFNPSAVFGAQIDFTPRVRAGAAFQLPFYISGSGKFETRMPSSGFYDNATVVGDRADVSFTLPPSLRVGLEVDPAERWRAELAASIEFWSVHDQFSIEPRDVRIEGAPGVGTYELGALDIARNYKNSYSVNLGVEGRPMASKPLTVLAGYAYETAAAPTEYLTVLTVDGNKHLLAAGLGYEFGKLMVNATAGVALMGDRTVAAGQGRSQILTPIRDDPDDPNPLRVYVNDGDYSSSWLFAGVGIGGAF